MPAPEASTDEQNEYLCLFHLITAGLLEESLGSDEQEIIEMIFLIIDAKEKRVSETNDGDDRLDLRLCA